MTADGPLGEDVIADLFNTAAARSELDRLLEGKTPDEQRDLLLGLALNAIGQLARRNDALAALVGKTVAVVEVHEREIARLKRETGNTRGPFIRRVEEGNDE